MKRLLFALVLFTSPFAYGQVPPSVDILSPWRGPFGILGRNLAWGLAGVGGMSNTFVLDTPSPQRSACIVIQNNNPTNPHSFRMIAFVTFDPTLRGPISTPSSTWLPANLSTTSFSGATSALIYTVPLAGAVAFSISPASGSKIAIAITDTFPAGGTPDTANIYYNFGSPSPCSVQAPDGAQMFVTASNLFAGTLSFSLVGPSTSGATYVGNPQTWKACTVYSDIAPIAGGTINTYVSSYDSTSTLEDDRISLLQVAGAEVKQSATVNFEVNVNPHALSVHALAAGTVQNGILSDSMKLTYVTAGGGAHYSTWFMAICH